MQGYYCVKSWPLARWQAAYPSYRCEIKLGKAHIYATYRLRVPGIGRLCRLGEWCWLRLRRRAVRLLMWQKEGGLTFLAACESAIPYGALLFSPHAATIMRDFRWRDYRKLNPDVVLDTELQACKHFIYRGYSEGRLMDAERLRRFDPSFYSGYYPELRLRNDWEARVHYSYAGYYERRVANTVDQWVCDTTLHIFQPGKVGSHAISAAIDGKYPGGALHLHWPTDLPLNFPWTTMAYPEVVNRPRSQHLRIISAARDVVSYVLSGAFQYLSTTASEWGARPNVETVRAYLESSFENNCRALENWFDHQFYCGMDIYTHGFDHERGFVCLSNDVITLFLYRVENLAQLETELGRFLAMDNFQLRRVNDAASKAYWKDYCDLFNNYVVSGRSLEKLYTSRYMRHFFSDAERARRIEYWSKPRANKLH